MIALTLTLALAFGGESSPPNSPENAAARRALIVCVERAATRLERSREAANIVADAAIIACRVERANFIRLAGGDDWRYERAIMSKLDEHLRQLAQARVVTIRADRP